MDHPNATLAITPLAAAVGSARPGASWHHMHMKHTQLPASPWAHHATAAVAAASLPVSAGWEWLQHVAKRSKEVIYLG